MKLRNDSERPEMRPEYEFDYSTAIRGKYYRRLLREGANVVVLDPDVAKGLATWHGPRGRQLKHDLLMPRTGRIAQLKVTLRWSRPPIWRRCLVPTDATLAELHQVLQIAMDWHDSHLHQFRQGSTYYGVPDPEFPPERKDERRIRVSQVLRSPKDKMIYEYDFGDGWEHEVVLEKMLQPEAGQRYPRVIAGKRACPPEDCGGVGGYYHLLEVLADPKHPEHRDLMEWCGGGIDPDFFDLKDTNEAMALEFGRGKGGA